MEMNPGKQCHRVFWTPHLEPKHACVGPGAIPTIPCCDAGPFVSSPPWLLHPSLLQQDHQRHEKPAQHQGGAALAHKVDILVLPVVSAPQAARSQQHPAGWGQSTLAEKPQLKAPGRNAQDTRVAPHLPCQVLRFPVPPFGDSLETSPTCVEAPEQSSPMHGSS